jgi:hypothetical protein
MLVTLCQSDTEEIRTVASETLLSLGEFVFVCSFTSDILPGT